MNIMLSMVALTLLGQCSYSSAAAADNATDTALKIINAPKESQLSSLSLFPADQPFLAFCKADAPSNNHPKLHTQAVVRTFCAGVILLHAYSEDATRLKLACSAFENNLHDHQLLRTRIEGGWAPIKNLLSSLLSTIKSALENTAHADPVKGALIFYAEAGMKMVENEYCQQKMLSRIFCISETDISQDDMLAVSVPIIHSCGLQNPEQCFNNELRQFVATRAEKYGLRTFAQSLLEKAATSGNHASYIVLDDMALHHHTHEQTDQLLQEESRLVELYNAKSAASTLCPKPAWYEGLDEANTQQLNPHTILKMLQKGTASWAHKQNKTQTIVWGSGEDDDNFYLHNDPLSDCIAHVQ